MTLLVSLLNVFCQEKLLQSYSVFSAKKFRQVLLLRGVLLLVRVLKYCAKKVIFSALTIREIESERKVSISFWITFAAA